jgi:hypothetical protein
VKTKKRLEIEVETIRLTIRRTDSVCRLLPCALCAAEVEMLTAETAALLCGLTLRSLVGHLDIGALHFTETADGLLYICLNSLTGSALNS